LDISHKPAEFLKNHFPTIYQRCLKVGIDITQQPIPVVPAAHYTCGGVVTNLQGQTDLPRLYAIGETAYTGLHGANRLASNSLLEGLVFAEAARQHILSQPLTQPSKDPKPWDTSKVSQAKERILVTHDWDEVRRVMWDYVGIVRTNSRLARALRRIQTLEAEVEEFYRHHLLDVDTLELRNLTLVAKLMVLSAQARQESRGLHYNLDYPELQPASTATILTP
jgi:L-aspartate oxidase